MESRFRKYYLMNECKYYDPGVTIVKIYLLVYHFSREILYLYRIILNNGNQVILSGHLIANDK